MTILVPPTENNGKW